MRSWRQVGRQGGREGERERGRGRPGQGRWVNRSVCLDS